MASIAEGQIESRRNVLGDMRVVTQEDVAEHNFMVGEKYGIAAFLALPQNLIEAAEELVYERSDGE